MNLLTRRVALQAFFVTAVPALAQAYPARPVRLIVPFGPGQGADLVARIVARKLSEVLKQAIIVDNKPGAGGNIGAEAAAMAAPDGYTLLIGSTATHGLNAAMYKQLPYDPNDFVPVGYIGSVPIVLSVGPSSKSRSLRELLDKARAEPNTVDVALGNPGARAVLAELQYRAKVEFVPVLYKTSAQGFTDVMGGQVPVIVDSLAGSMPHLSSGRIRGLAISCSVRSKLAPNIQTFVEAGLAGFDIVTWNAIFAPRATPSRTLELLNTSIASVLTQPETVEDLRRVGYETSQLSAAPLPRMAEFIASESKKWGEIARRAGILPE